MEATSDAQYAAFEKDTAPGLEQLRDDIWAVGLPLPMSKYQPFYSLLYLLRDFDGGIHLVDPGLDIPENWDIVVAALDEIGAGLGRVRSLVSTHQHPDHIGLSDRLREATGAAVYLHRDEQHDLENRVEPDPAKLAAQLAEWGMPQHRAEELLGMMGGRSPMEWPTPRADVLLENGDVLPIHGFELEVIATPGHTPGHIALFDAERNVLFTGDHLLPNQIPGIGLGSAEPATNPLMDYIASLRRLPGDPEVLPGHGYRFRGLGGRVEEIAHHHLRRAREVSAELEKEPDLPIWELASRLTWTAGWENLAGFYVVSALRQTAMNRDYVLGGGPLEY